MAPGFDRSTLLQSLADGVIVPTYQAFAARAAELETATATYRDSLEDSDLEAARAAWRAAADEWQVAELTQVGPAAVGGASGRVGGLGLRDEIYAWPFANPCWVDQELVSFAFEQPGYFEGKINSTYGLDALEYLLFVDPESAENECPPQVDINTGGTWESITSELRERRARYAAAVAAKLKDDADRLVAEWTGGFRDGFVEAGQGASPYRTAQLALDEVFAAIYYLELRTKDEKLGAPAGLNSRCLQPTCPDRIESQWADRSRTFIHRNVVGFEAMLRGAFDDDAEAVGFYAFLDAAGASDLAERLRQLTASARSATDDVEPEMIEALDSAKQELAAQHAALTELLTLVKTELVTDLALEIPREGAADND